MTHQKFKELKGASDLKKGSFEEKLYRIFEKVLNSNGHDPFSLNIIGQILYLKCANITNNLLINLGFLIFLGKIKDNKDLVMNFFNLMNTELKAN